MVVLIRDCPFLAICHTSSSYLILLKSPCKYPLSLLKPSPFSYHLLACLKCASSSIDQVVTKVSIYKSAPLHNLVCWWTGVLSNNQIFSESFLYAFYAIHLGFQWESLSFDGFNCPIANSFSFFSFRILIVQLYRFIIHGPSRLSHSRFLSNFLVSPIVICSI